MMMMNTIPYCECLVVMVGPSGAGKSTLIARHFEANEVVSSDAIREELTGDFRLQHRNGEVFELFHSRISDKLKLGLRVVADATHLRRKDRLETSKVARELGIPVYYVVVNRPIHEKVVTGGWRNEVIIGGTSLIQKHENSFASEFKEIMKGDGFAVVIDKTR